MIARFLRKLFRRKPRLPQQESVDPLGRAFFLDGDLVGLLEGNVVPSENGLYSYMALRGPGHLKMIQTLSGHEAVCTCSNDTGASVTFTVTSVKAPNLLHVRVNA